MNYKSIPEKTVLVKTPKHKETSDSGVILTETSMANPKHTDTGEVLMAQNVPGINVGDKVVYVEAFLTKWDVDSDKDHTHGVIDDHAVVAKVV